MSKPGIGYGFSVLLFLVSINTISDELDEKTQEAIVAACHGNLLDKGTGVFSEFLYKNSPVCEEVVKQAVDADIEPILDRHNIRLTQEEINRINDRDYLKPLGANTIEQECMVHTPGERSGPDRLCRKIRTQLEAENMPMSQEQYEQLANYCKAEPSLDVCIEDRVNNQWRKGNRRLPVRGLSLDDRIGGGHPAAAGSEPDTPARQGGVDLDGLMASRNPDNHGQKLVGGSLGFDNIYAAREKIKIDGIKQDLFEKGEIIASQCQCVFNQQSCYEPRDYDFKQLTEAAQGQAPRFSQRKVQVCQAWRANLRGKTSDQESSLNDYLKNSNIILGNLDKLDSGFEHLISELGEQERSINAEIARREAEQRRVAEQQARKSNGNAFGKMVAIAAVGTVVGTSGISTEQGMKVFTSITQDILEDNGTMTNTMRMMESNGYDSLNFDEPDFNSMTGETMASVNSYQDQQNQVGNTNLDLGNQGAGGIYTLKCDIGLACAVYSFTSKQEFDENSRQCAKVISGSCKPGPSCTETAPGRSVTTYFYAASAGEVKSVCEANGGSYQ